MLFNIKLFLKSKWINNVLILQQLIIITAILTIYEACPESKCTQFLYASKKCIKIKKITWLHQYICVLFFYIVAISFNVGCETAD